MRFSISTLIRLIAVVLVVANAVALGIGQLAPQSSSRHFAEAAAPTSVNGFFLPSYNPTPLTIDAVTGKMTTLPFHDESALHHASFSPWADESGRSEVVVRWSGSSASDAPSQLAYGIARYSFPDGRLIDKFSSEIIPTATPAWFPGTESRVIFPSGDGNLYVMNFSGEPASLGSPREPQRVLWETDAFGGQQVMVEDITWPRDPQFGGRLLASISIENPKDHNRLIPAEIWLLELDEAGTAVVEATPLKTDNPFLEGHAKRFPTIVKSPDGQLSMLALSHPDGNGIWTAWVAPIEVTNGGFAWTTSHATRVIERCIPSAVAISADGQWVACLAQNQRGSFEVLRARLDLPSKSTPPHYIAHH